MSIFNTQTISALLRSHAHGNTFARRLQKVPAASTSNNVVLRLSMILDGEVKETQRRSDCVLIFIVCHTHQHYKNCIDFYYIYHEYSRLALYIHN